MTENLDQAYAELDAAMVRAIAARAACDGVDAESFLSGLMERYELPARDVEYWLDRVRAWQE